MDFSPTLDPQRWVDHAAPFAAGFTNLYTGHIRA